MKKVPKEIKFLIFSALLTSGLFFSNVVFGAGFSGFGGRITNTVQCTCGGGTMVTVDGGFGTNSKSSGTYLCLAGTQRGTLTNSKKIIGMYSRGGTCKVQVGTSCITRPITKGTIKRYATN